MIEARKIRDSIGEHSPRLLAIRATNPKFIHQETLRHRMIYIEDALRGDPDFSFSVSSARAVPFRKLRDEAFYSHLRAKPVKWGAEQKGMSPADEESPEIIAQAEQIWEEAARDAVRHAERMAVLGRHKSIVNRIIEPYIHDSDCTRLDELLWAAARQGCRSYPAGPRRGCVGRVERVGAAEAEAR
jgi:hypothetical protein